MNSLVEKYVPKATLLQSTKKKKRIAIETYIEIHNDRYLITYYVTPLIVYNVNLTVTLNTNGHRSATTKSRLNEYTPATIVQRKKEWWITDAKNGAVLIPFHDGLVVDQDGLPIEVAQEELVYDELIGKFTTPFT